MSYYQPPAGTQYPYGYHPQAPTGYHPGTPGAYPPYQYPPQGYGGAWPYPYTYYAQQQPAQPAASTSRVAVAPPASASIPTTTANATVAPTTAAPINYAPATVPTTSTMSTSTPAATVPLQRSYSTTQYSYPYRESIGSFRSSNRKKKLFDKELRQLMYGFGDDRAPAPDTVDVMEEILIEYIIDICQTSTLPGKKSRLSIEDLRRALSRPADAGKLARMEELLFMQEDIKRARAQFEDTEMNQAGSFQA